MYVSITKMDEKHVFWHWSETESGDQISASVSSVKIKLSNFSCTPFLNDARRKLVLSIAGAFGINPLVLITSIVMRGECKETRVDRSDKDFQVDLHDMAHSMVESYLELERKQEEIENFY